MSRQYHYLIHFVFKESIPGEGCSLSSHQLFTWLERGRRRGWFSGPHSGRGAIHGHSQDTLTTRKLFPVQSQEKQSIRYPQVCCLPSSWQVPEQYSTSQNWRDHVRHQNQLWLCAGWRIWRGNGERGPFCWGETIRQGVVLTICIFPAACMLTYSFIVWIHQNTTNK